MMNEGVKTSFDFSGMASLKAKAASEPNDDVTVKETAKQFESLLLQMMLKSMREATPDGGLFSNSGSKTFEDMFDQQVVMAMAERGETGIAQMVETFISRSQDALTDQINGRSFSLQKPAKDALPLVNESTRFEIPEGVTRDFLLNRAKFGLGGEK